MAANQTQDRTRIEEDGAPLPFTLSVLRLPGHAERSEAKSKHAPRITPLR